MISTPTTLTRRDRNKLQNKKEILDAALSVFATKGYQHASMQEIADQADFAISTLYALFDGKEDLYHQVSVDAGKRCGVIFNEAMNTQDKNPYQILVRYMRAKGRVVREMPEACRMLEMEGYEQDILGGKGLRKNGIGDIYAHFMLRIEKLFEEGIRMKLFVDGDPALLAVMLDSTTNALMRLAQSDPEHYDYDTRIEEMITLFFTSALRPKNDTA